MENIFLGMIAVATMVMAAIQTGAILVVARLARRVNRLTERLEQDVRPVVADLAAISSSAARAASLAAAQVERADRLFADLTRRVDDTLSVIQHVIVTPAREARALLAAVGAALAAFGEIRQAGRRRASAQDDEDPLFIG